MSLIVRIAITIGLLAPFVSVASEAELSAREIAALESAAAWVVASDPESLAMKWPYHFGPPAACKPRFTSLFELPRLVTAKDGSRVVEPARFEGWWLYSDLENGRFWIAKTEGYFGTAHFYGPARLTDSGSLGLIPKEQEEPCHGS